MAKSLSERIAERVSQRKAPGRGGKNRAAFLALRDEIALALADGWSARAVWETLKEEGKIDFSYDPFTKYVKQLIEQPQQTPSQSSVPPSPTLTPVDPGQSTARAAAEDNATSGAAEQGNPRHERRQPQAGFRLTHTRKEDLI